MNYSPFASPESVISQPSPKPPNVSDGSDKVHHVCSRSIDNNKASKLRTPDSILSTPLSTSYDSPQRNNSLVCERNPPPHTNVSLNAYLLRGT